MMETLGREFISTRQRTIAELVRREPKLTLMTLAHHMDGEWMREAYRRVRKDAAAGVDGVTAAQYETELEANLSTLLERFKSDRYAVPTVRRVQLPGTSKTTRLIGIPTLEDKILQRAVLMVLEPVYEHDFLDCSYGFRPGREVPEAMGALWVGSDDLGDRWVIDVSIKNLWGSMDGRHLRRFLDRRVRDGVIRRALEQWFSANVTAPETVGCLVRARPQSGDVLSMLGHIYLHEVLDLWFEHEVKPRLRGRAFEVRYANNPVLVLKHEDDARRVLRWLVKRLSQFRLRLHPDEARIEHCRDRLHERSMLH